MSIRCTSLACADHYPRPIPSLIQFGLVAGSFQDQIRCELFATFAPRAASKIVLLIA